MTKKKLGFIGLISGGIATMMLFVIPFFIPKEYDTKENATIYFITFLILIFIGNITMEKSNKVGTIQDERDNKLREIL